MTKIDFMRPMLFMYFVMARRVRALLNLRVFHDSRPIVCNQINDSAIPHLYSRVSTAHLSASQMLYAPINTLVAVNVFCSEFAFKRIENLLCPAETSIGWNWHSWIIFKIKCWLIEEMIILAFTMMIVFIWHMVNFSMIKSMAIKRIFIMWFISIVVVFFWMWSIRIKMVFFMREIRIWDIVWLLSRHIT